MVQHTSKLIRAIISERKIFRTSSAMRCMKHSIWNNRVLHEVVERETGFRWRDISAPKPPKRQHMNGMARVNWDRGQYDVTLVTFWRQTLRKHDPPASFIVVPLLPYFISQSSAVRCNSTITAYVISLNISTQNPDTHYISMCYLRLCLARIVYWSGP